MPGVQIQVLFSQKVSGTGPKGPYEFYRHSCVVVGPDGKPQAVGDLITDAALEPGSYHADFQVQSYQGKLSVKIIPLPIPR